MNNFLPLNPDDEPQEDYARRTRYDAAREVERLVAANAQSNQTMTRLVDKVRVDAEKRERKIELLEMESRQIRRLLIMVGAAICILLTMAVFNAYNILSARHSASQSAQVARDTAETNQLLLSCFDTNSRCAQLNADATRRLQDEIKLFQLTGQYCLRANPLQKDPSGDKFLACVKRLYPNGPVLKGR